LQTEKFALQIEFYTMDNKKEKEIIKYIDLDKVFKEKNARLYKLLPKFLLKYIKKTIHQDDLNNDLHELTTKDKKGVNFFHHFISMRGLSYKLHGTENLPKEGRFILASNHALGGLDGIVLISAIGKYYENIRFIVNDLLLNLPNTSPIFLPVNKHGANSREYSEIIDKSYKSDNEQMLIFPAGLVSRRIKGEIKDLEWKDSFIKKAKQYQRDIIPIYFEGRNSNFFYNIARFRKIFGIKANLEMFYLVDELYKKKNTKFNIYIGKPIPHETFTNNERPKKWAEFVRNKVYELPKSG